MDRELISEKLESLRRCIQRISDKRPSDAATLQNDFDLQDIISLNLSRAVQLCVDIGAHAIADTTALAPQTMGQVFERLAELGRIDPELAGRLKKAVGFRNITVHHYEAVDWHIVFSIVTKHLSDFSDFAKAAASWPE